MSIFIKQLSLSGFLSFEEDSMNLLDLNLLIGHNGSGKSNFIEAISLLQSTPRGIVGPIRRGGGVADWIWKGKEPGGRNATIEAILVPDGRIAQYNNDVGLCYRLSFADRGGKFEIIDERIENEQPLYDHKDPRRFFFYDHGQFIINVGNPEDRDNKRRLERDSIDSEKSILLQRKDPDNYPELTWLGSKFEKIRIYRDWSSGRETPLRMPQKTDLETDFLREDFLNLGLILNNLQTKPEPRRRILEALSALYPDITDYAVLIEGNTTQIFLHEGRHSIPATRLSDGTLRYLSLLAILCHPNPPPLICIEEPELGLHPDAIQEIARLLKEAANKTQLVVATHSDHLIDMFSDTPEYVVTFEKGPDSSIMERLSREDLSDWLRKYTLGEMRKSGHIRGNRY